MVILTTYRYALNDEQLRKFQKLKDETGVPIARQIDFALGYYLEQCDRRPEAWKRDLMAYLAGKPNRPTNS